MTVIQIYELITQTCLTPDAIMVIEQQLQMCLM